MGEDEDEEEEEEEEDADNRGDDVAPPAIAPPPLVHPAAMPEEVNEEGTMEAIPEQEALMLHEVILEDAEPEVP
jgi:hypothetical protein